MSAIIKDDILTDVNENLNLNESESTLDTMIHKVLSDMSNRGLLVGTDSTQTLVDGSKTLNYPTGFRSAINITLTDGSGNELRPLIKLSGGQKEYRREIAHGSFTSNPTYFSEFENKFYLLGSSAAAYTVLIEFRKNHAKDANNIEFTTEFENLMFAGTTFYKALQLNRSASMGTWGTMYQDELRKAVLNRKQQPSLLLG